VVTVVVNVELWLDVPVLDAVVVADVVSVVETVRLTVLTALTLAVVVPEDDTDDAIVDDADEDSVALAVDEADDELVCVAVEVNELEPELVAVDVAEDVPVVVGVVLSHDAKVPSWASSTAPLSTAATLSQSALEAIRMTGSAHSHAGLLRKEY
jgi:hypothetical protein